MRKPMKTKHVFVALLDVSHLLAFGLGRCADPAESLAAVEKSRAELEIFMNALEKEFKEPVWYMGTDILADKMYERFMFEGGGFLEIIIERPIAISAHFIDQQRARRFAAALKRTIEKCVVNSPHRDMLISGITVEKETG